MAGTLRRALHPQRSRLILYAWLVLSACWCPGMAARWSAAVFLEDEKSFRKIMGFRDLWALKAILDGLQPATRQAVA